MNYNYADLLSLDRVTSIVRTKSFASRKLVAWADRLTATDYPDSWVIDMHDGTFITLDNLTITDDLEWDDGGTNSYTVVFTDGAIVSTRVTADGSTYDATAVEEGDLTLADGRVISFCNAEVRAGDDEVRLSYGDIPRDAVADELDSYIQSRMLTLEDRIVKGDLLDGVWRLSDINKSDFDNPDDRVKTNNAAAITLIYMRGYAKELGSELDFPEALIMNKEDFRTDSTNLVIKFPNMDPRYVETAKDAYRNQSVLSNPVFGGVVYDGYWNNIKMITSETNGSGDRENSASVIWYLTQHNNTDLYFRYYARPGIIKGHYFKWEATETTLDDLISTTFFDELGFIDSDDDPELKTPRVSWNLQEEVPARSVQHRRTSRGEDDRLFDTEIELTWVIEGSEAYIRSVIGDRISIGTISLENKTQKQIEAFMESALFTTDGRRLFI